MIESSSSNLLSLTVLPMLTTSYCTASIPLRPQLCGRFNPTKTVSLLKPSAFSSVLVPSASLSLTLGSLDAKLGMKMDSFHVSLPQLCADPQASWLWNSRNVWEER